MYLGKFNKVSTLRKYLVELGLDFVPKMGRVTEEIIFKHCVVKITGVIFNESECNVKTEIEEVSPA